MENLIEILWQTIVQMQFMWKIVAFVFIGIVIAEKISNLPDKYKKILGLPFRPLTRICRLPEEIGAILIPSMFTVGIISSSTLGVRYRSGVINERQTVVASVLNGTTAYSRRIVMHILPIYIALFSWQFVAGIMFYNILIIVAQTSFCIIYSKIFLKEICPPKETCQRKFITQKTDKKTGNHSLQKILKTFFRIVPKMVFITFAIFLLVNLGLLDKILSPMIEPVVKLLSLPEKFLTSIATFLTGNPVAGSRLLSDLLAVEMFRPQEVFLGVILGTIISMPAIIATHVLPNHVPVFGWKMTGKIITMPLLVNIIVRISFLLIAKAILL